MPLNDFLHLGEGSVNKPADPETVRFLQDLTRQATQAGTRAIIAVAELADQCPDGRSHEVDVMVGASMSVLVSVLRNYLEQHGRSPDALQIVAMILKDTASFTIAGVNAEDAEAAAEGW